MYRNNGVTARNNATTHILIKALFILLTTCTLQEKVGAGVVRDTTFSKGDRDKFTAMKVPMQYPLVLLVNVGW
jgi:hypothetical protein